MLRRAAGRGGGGGDLPTSYGSNGSGGGYANTAGGGGYANTAGGGGAYSGYNGAGYNGNMGVASGAATSAPNNIYSSSSPRSRKKTFSGGSGGSSDINPFYVSVALAILFFVTTLYYRGQYFSAYAELHDTRSAHEDIKQEHSAMHTAHSGARDQIQDLRVKRDELQRDVSVKDGKIRNLERQVGLVEKERDRLKGELEVAKKSGSENPEVAAEKKARKDASDKQLKDMRDHIARESYRTALERFGPGPHMVKFQVELPKDTAFPTMPENPEFTILLNPLDKMPHSVHLFLEQIYHKLWDGCSFVVNAEHIMQAGAHPGGAIPEDKMEPFVESRLDVLSYQEYHDDYSHRKYTLGFAGRPGGPDFYINKMDNVENHGPGGQENWVLYEEADPCFAKVIDGFNVVDRLFAMPANKANDNILTKPIHIMKAYLTSLVNPNLTPRVGHHKVVGTVGTHTEDEEDEDLGAYVPNHYEDQEFDHDYHKYRRRPK